MTTRAGATTTRPWAGSPPRTPLGDTGGDHDLYDYCVDDPVSFADTTGLREIPISITDSTGFPKISLPPPFENGRKAARLIAYLGVHGAAALGDKITEAFQGAPTRKCRDGAEKGWKCFEDVVSGRLLGKIVTEQFEKYTK